MKPRNETKNMGAELAPGPRKIWWLFELYFPSNHLKPPGPRAGQAAKSALQNQGIATPSKRSVDALGRTIEKKAEAANQAKKRKLAQDIARRTGTPRRIVIPRK